nr:hypothetical protein [Tanacetum cinerariifolium]
MSSDSYATITYTSMSSYEVIVNWYFAMPMDPLDPYAKLVMEAPPSPDYIPGPEAPPSPDYIPGPEYPEYLPPADDKKARFTTPTGGYEVDESSVTAAARQIRPALTVDESRRAEDRLIGRLRRERRYFRTLSTNYAQEISIESQGYK